MIVEGGVHLNMIVRIANRNKLAQVTNIFNNKYGEYYKVKYMQGGFDDLVHEVVDKIDLYKANTIYDT
jgi:hypothetical protein